VLNLTEAGSSDFGRLAGEADDCVSGSTVLAGGTSCRVRVAFTASSTGVKTGSSGWTAGQSGTVQLSGTGRPPDRNLTVSMPGPQGGGGRGKIISSPAGISCEWTINGIVGPCSASFPEGTQVTLTAVSLAASRESITAMSVCDVRLGNTCRVDLTSDRSVSVTLSSVLGHFEGAEEIAAESPQAVAGEVSVVGAAPAYFAGGTSYLRKLDHTGVRWSKKPFRSGGVDIQVMALATDSAGDVYVAGNRFSNAYLGKYRGSDGALIWEDVATNPNYDDWTSVALEQVNTGGLVELQVAVAGRSDSSTANPDIRVARYKASTSGAGNAPVYSAIYDGPDNKWDQPFAVALDRQGNVYAAGFVTTSASKRRARAEDNTQAYGVVLASSGEIITASNLSGNWATVLQRVDEATGAPTVMAALDRTGRRLRIDATDHLVIAHEDGAGDWVARYTSNGLTLLSRSSLIENANIPDVGVDTYGNLSVAAENRGGDWATNWMTRLGP
jgi:hypothetical protein